MTFLEYILQTADRVLALDTEYKSDNLPFNLCKWSDGWNILISISSKVFLYWKIISGCFFMNFLARLI